MSNRNVYLEAFTSVAQPIVVVTNDRVEYMNPPAVSLFKSDKTGAPASLLFPSHVLNTQAESFVTTAFIGTKSCSVNVSCSGSSKIYVLTPAENTAPDNSVIYAKLRTALSNIRFATGCISIFGENSNDEKLLDYVRTLNRSYNSIKRTVDNMNAIGLLERGELPFFPESFDAAEHCRSIISALQFMLKNDDIEISLSSPEQVRIIADRALFEQLLMNLISNSIQHCGKAARIRISLLRTDKNLILGVSDDGSGIEPEKLSGIFSAYRRPVNLIEGNDGTGMGLAIVRGIAELHGGAVIIESRGRDMGTSVRVMLSAEISPRSRFSEILSGEEITQRMLTAFSDLLPDECYSAAFDD